MGDPFVIIGASHAGVSLASSLRQRGWTDGIVLIERQKGTPVQRPPLSKAALKMDWPLERNYIQSAKWFEKADVQLLDGTSVTAIDPSGRSVSTGAGETIAWSKLALATGAIPRRLTCSGHDFKGVHYVRVLADVEALRDDLGAVEKAVIVGGGYIGLEVAACLKGLGKDVTVIEMAERLLARVATPAMSAFFHGLHERHGVGLVVGTAVDRIEGGSRVERVVTSSGETIECDAVVAGIGVVPDLGLLSFLDEQDENGIPVSAACQTSHPDIYAIGDIAKYPWPFARMRVESIHNAQFTAAVAAHHALGLDPPSYEAPWFWSDQHGGKLQSVGIPLDWDSVVWRAGAAENAGAAFAFKGDTLVSVEAFDFVPAFMLGKKLFAGKSPVKRSEIDDASNDLLELAKRKV